MSHAHEVDWGSVPAYFGGLAFVATVWIIGRDHRERRRDQAAKVAAWAVDDDSNYRVLVRNASDLPIRNLKVEFLGSDGRLTLSKFPADAATRRMKPKTISVLGPDQTLSVYKAERGPLKVVAIEFDDAIGATWVNDERGLHKRSALIARFYRTRSRLRGLFKHNHNAA